MTQRRAQLLDDAVETQQAVLDVFQAGVFTAFPAILVAVTGGGNTATVQPAIQAQFMNVDGSYRLETISVLVDCPIVYPSGGGFALTFPLQPGDDVLVVIANRCIDSWWQSGGVQAPLEFRMHDLSDGFIIPGPRSVPQHIPDVSTDSVQLRKDDGSAFIEIQSDGDVVVVTDQNVNVTADGDVVVAAANVAVTASVTASITAPLINLVGNVAITGGSLTHNGINIGDDHVHSGVVTGSDETGGPIP